MAALAVAVLALAPSRAEAQGSVAGDKTALEKLYDSAGGANWTANTNWKSTEPLGTWHGVTTNSGGRVIALSLRSNALNGSLPAELGDLSELTNLTISGHSDLSGTIPTKLGDLTALTDLNLSNNKLTGAIPSVLGTLPNLMNLILSQNSLTGAIPPELGNLADSLNRMLISANSGLTGCVPYRLRGVKFNDFGSSSRPVCPAPEATLELDASPIAENGGRTTVTATLAGPVNEDVTLTVSAAPVAPAVADDFTLSANKVLTIAAGQLSSTGDVTITGVDNSAYSPDKTVTVSAAAMGDGVQDPDPVTLTITSEDLPKATLVLAPSPVTEDGGVVTVTATAEGPAFADATLTVSASPVAPAVAGDFRLSTNKELTIESGQTTSTGTVTITTVNNDVFLPGKTMTVSATATGNGVTAPDSATLAIVEDEPPPELTVTLHLEPSTIDEDGGRTTVTATLSEPASPILGTIILPVLAESASQEGAGAFVLSANTVLTIPAGETGSTGEVTITAVDNDAAQPDRTVTVRVELPHDSITLEAPRTLTIMDDDAAPGPGPGPGPGPTPGPGPDPTPEPPPTATLSLERSTIDENGGATTVTAALDGAATEDVTLTVSAAPVAPAAAGDFTLSANTVLTIAAGETESTGDVTLTAVDNSVYAPDDKTVTVSAAAAGAGVQDPASVTLTIVEDDEKGMEERDTEMVLSGMARGLASGAVNVLGGRFDASPAGGARMTLAGHRLQAAESTAADGALPAWYGTTSTDPHGWAGASLDDQLGPGTALSERDLLLRSSFELPLNASGAAGAPAWTLWGRGAASGFSGSSDPGLDLDGTFYSGYLGMDYRPRPNMLLGLALSHSKGTVDYERTGEGAADAEIDVKLNSVLPYVHWEPQSGLGVWTLVGAGSGDMRVTTEGGATVTTDLASYLGAAGVRRELATLKGVDLAVKADAFTATVHSKGKADEGLPKVRGNAVRVRTAVEGSLDWETGPDSRLTPSLELGGRWDDGTSERGLGAEVGGGLAYTHTGLGLSVEAEGRYLLVHKVSSLDEWGASLKVKLDPGAAGQGASLSVAPVWGRAAGGSDRLWANTGVLDQLGSRPEDPGWTPQQLDVALAYGLPLSRERGMVTPYSGVTLGGSDSTRYRVGSRLTFGPSLNLTLEGERTEQADEPVSHGLSAQLGVRW